MSVVAPVSDHPTQNSGFLRCFFGTQTSVRAVLSDVTAFLTEARIGSDQRDSVELVLAETFNNIVEHAYAGAGGAIDLKIDVQGETLVIDVVDHGHPMPNHTLPEMPEAIDLSALSREDLPEGGWDGSSFICSPPNWPMNVNPAKTC